MIEEIKKELWAFIDVSSALDLDKLPNYAKKSIQFLQWSWNTPLETFLMVLNLKTVQMLSYNRIKFSWNEDTEIIWDVLMNIYWINFLHSWWWKDKTITAIEKYFLWFFQSEFDKNNDLYIKDTEEKVKKYAEETLEWSKAEQTRYKKEHAPRPFNKELWDATAEWFAVSRETLQSAHFWSMFISIDELSLYIKSMKPEAISFFKSVVSSYEWSSTPKVIKSERVSIATKWIPNNVLMYSSVKWLLDWQWRENLMNFLEIWFARRSFICFPDKVHRKSFNNFDALLDNRRSIRKAMSNTEIKSEIEAVFKNAFYSTELKKTPDDWYKNAIITIFKLRQEDAVRQYLMYQVYCQNCADKIEDWIQAIETRERYWKMIKLATMIACIRHPKELDITIDDINYAIYQTEFFWLQASKFFNHEEKSNEEIIFDYILSKWEVSKTEIRDDLKLVNKNKFKAFLENILPNLHDFVEEKNMKLIEKKEWIKSYFSIKEFDVKNTNKLKITCSQWISNEAASNTMKPFSIDFDNVPKLTAVDKTYSFSQYNEEHRKQSNATWVINVLALDIDDNIDIKKAKELLKDYRWYITTTRNHQKDKKWLKCDRFRVMIPIVEGKFTNKEFKNCLTNFEKNIFWEWMLDSACFEIARMFFWNPEQQVFELGWEKIIDLKLFYKEEVEKKYNPLPKQEYQWKADNVIDFDWYNYDLEPWKTKPVKCISWQHSDNKKSAFIGCSDKTGKKFIKCSACNLFWWEG